ncbi:MAG: DUF4082 domain-containing protein, partial [Gammaproteobacteria bacterium]
EGWKQAYFAEPVAITEDTIYIASYFCPDGFFAIGLDYFTASGYTNGPLTALSTAEAAPPGNGLYIQSATSAFPNTSFRDANYWVDVIFAEPV